MEAELTISLWTAMFAACIFTLAGAGLMGISLAILVAARAHVCPVPETEVVYVSAAVVDEPEPVSAAIDEELAQLHARVQREWRFPEPSQRHPGNPEPPAQEPAVLFDQTSAALLGATGAFSLADLERFMAEEDAKERAKGTFTTNGKRKGASRKRQLAGAR